MRVALDDAAPLYRVAIELREVKETGTLSLKDPMGEALPNASIEA